MPDDNYLLPATLADLRALRTKERSVLDYVDDINEKLWEDPEYQQYLQPIDNATSVTGSTTGDDLMAAMMIRQYAKDNRIAAVVDTKPTKIAGCLRRVLNGRHQNASRKARKLLLLANGHDTNEE